MSSMSQTLFGLVPTSSTGQQWIARSMQLINWGGYDGYHDVALASTATLLSGGSGTGKSTLLDAYIALTMTHTTPFNGASNAASSGRARGPEQRNVISYVRGKLDEARVAGTDASRDAVLRGDTSDTWSALAMTWADQTGRTFTAVRAYYVPRGATRNDECVLVRATYDGELDLRVLEPAAAARFARPSLTAMGLDLYDTDVAFTTRLHSALGIGAAGDGAKAMALLARIQAGQQITTVDALYKAMVLEEPETLARATEAVEHFDELSEVREEMLTAQRQLELLAPMTELRSRVDQARSDLGAVDGLGLEATAEGGTPFQHWHDTRRLALARAQERANREDHAVVEARRSSLDAQVLVAERELEEVRDSQRRNGGDEIGRLEREVVALEDALGQVEARHAAFERHRRVLDVEVDGKGDFERLRREAGTFVADRETQQRALGEQVFAARTELAAAEQSLAALEREKAFLAGRRSNVPEGEDLARRALAEAAGLDPADLPFVAELIDVRPEYEPWRSAIGQALGGFALTLLVDSDDLPAFRRAINNVRTERRVRFEGVPTGRPVDEQTDRTLLDGRLELRHGPFTGWLAETLAQRFSYVCVDDAAELGRHRRALTRTGQTSDGQRGAHGGRAGRSVLGFSSDRRIAELDEARREAEVERARARRAVEEALANEAGFTDRFAASRAVGEFTWDEIDVRGAARLLEERRARLDAVVAGSDVLRSLREDEHRVSTRLRGLREEHARTGVELESLERRWSDLTDEVDALGDSLAALEDAGVVASDEQVALLDEALAASPQKGADLRAFTAAVAGLQRDLVHRRELATHDLAAAREGLASIFLRFQEQWPNPNLGTDPDTSYDDYRRIHDDIARERMYALQERWSRAISRLSGRDLTMLNTAIEQAVAEIRTRMEPVNDILAQLPFHDDDHRLRITARVTEAADVTSFRRDLRTLAKEASADGTPAERERRYARMARLLARIRPESPERRRLVDVREHVRISAECIDLDGNHVSVYDHIAGKSGGESQELVAFIVGAALRYQLGDADAARPRYAPVFLDEAFIKADSRFAGRAVGAWRGLGFQLIIGAPLDKVAALEPHVDLVLQAVKDASGRSRIRWVAGAETVDAG
ncbi:ATP-binding protein [Sanguibacter massiliensis]|uniref:ATP-binding protein n=1 Tax=Sanguibacter massiliensis TaxID=1973217 RepID=UPI000C817416|nr:SbcC/MukB-like Walker B domain-containing protein [Sanguibacter massiliensis]